MITIKTLLKNAIFAFIVLAIFGYLFESCSHGRYQPVPGYFGARFDTKTGVSEYYYQGKWTPLQK